jgi:hypothetical protein
MTDLDPLSAYTRDDFDDGRWSGSVTRVDVDRRLAQRAHLGRTPQIIDRARDVIVVEQQLRHRTGRDAEPLRGGADLEAAGDE